MRLLIFVSSHCQALDVLDLQIPHLNLSTTIEPSFLFVSGHFRSDYFDLLFSVKVLLVRIDGVQLVDIVQFDRVDSDSAEVPFQRFLLFGQMAVVRLLGRLVLPSVLALLINVVGCFVIAR